MDAERIVMLVDMDAFFASVEQVARPWLRGRPIAVVGAQARTVLLSPSYEARAYGVRTGMRVPEAQQRCPHLLLVPADNARYTETHDRLLPIFSAYTPLVEVYSIDEVFLDVTTSSRLFGGAEAIGRAIKARTQAETDLTCSIGIAPNKLLAKLGSHLAKPDGLCVIQPDEAPARLEHLPVDDLWGIGPRTTEALAAMGVRTCGELARVPVEHLRVRFGILGERLSMMAQGRDDSPVVPTEVGPEPKGISHSMTLDRDTGNRTELEGHLLQLAERVGRRLREAGLSGRTVSVTLRYADFETFTRQEHGPQSRCDGREIYRTAVRIFRAIRLRDAVRLVGVSVTDLVREAQLPLFETDRRQQRLISAMDRVNDRYGEFTVTWATLLHRHRHRGVISPAWRPSGPHRVRFPSDA